MIFVDFQKRKRRKNLFKKTKKVFITIILSSTMIGFPKSIAKDNQNFWEEFIQLRESKFGKDEKYINKLSDCRIIADNLLKSKKVKGDFNKRVWAVSNCIKNYEAIIDVKKHTK